MYEYRATILRRVDADTLHVEVDLGIDVRHLLTIRLAGINAPELSTPEGKNAAAYVDLWIREHTGAGEIVLRTIKDRREKYGRYLGLIYPVELLVNALVPSLNDDLLAAGHAVPYP